MQKDRRTQDADQLAAELKKLSDAIVQRNFRAADEVRDAVGVVAFELQRTADRLKASGPALAALRDEATLQSHLALLEAKDKLMLLDDLVRRALDGAAKSPTFIGETARLKLALARMEATDLFEQKRRLLSEERRRIEAMTDAALNDIDAHLTALTTTKDRT
jgi:hypothetical protein